MTGIGNLFFREDYIGTISENTFPEYIFPELQEQEQEQEQEQIGSGEEESERLYVVPFEEVYLFRRHTRSYVKKLGGLKFIPALPRRKTSKKVSTYSKDSILVENLEELVDLSIQEIVQPLDQLDLESPVVSVFHSLHLESWLI